MERRVTRDTDYLRGAADPGRRRFLQLLGAGAAAATFPLSIRKALAIPAHHRTGTIADVEHIVFLMKENRAFDHYFGTLRGVRGFGDPHPVRLGNGDSVWSQPGADGAVLPFHPISPDLGMRFMEDLNHQWNDTVATWREGWYDQWVWQKSPATMAHYVRGDIPYHYALADAFTVCDAYHCSLLGPTQPNRLFMWTGWVGNDGHGGGPAVSSTEGTTSYGWKTYPERLQEAGVSWKIYQDVGMGMTPWNVWGGSDDRYTGNFGTNMLLFFKAYQDAEPGSPLYRRARRGTHAVTGESLFRNLREDVRTGQLPQVSWILAPEAYTEHPSWPANYGAWYNAQVLNALTSNPDVWSKTVLFLMYDENDGFFDHMVPPTPPMGSSLGASTVSVENAVFAGNEDHTHAPYGLGVRVPMLVISPWSKGGWVSSEVFDHTSLLRFVERRFGVRADNITPWRRAVCGDLTSTLDFANPDERPVALPSTAAFAPPERKRPPDYKPEPPADQRMPVQEPGQRPVRPVPYVLHVVPRVAAPGVKLALRNTGTAAAVFQVRTRSDAPRCYTVGPGGELAGSWKAGSVYALDVHGPNGFFRRIAGRVDHHPGEPEMHYDVAARSVELRMTPLEPVQLTIRDGYTHHITTHDLAAGQTWHQRWLLAASDGWYDLDVHCATLPAFRRHFAGHLENGQVSRSDPQLGAGT